MQTWIELCTSYKMPTRFEYDTKVQLFDTYLELYGPHIISDSHMLPNQHAIVSDQAVRQASACVRTFMETYDHVNIGVVLGLEILPAGRSSWVRLILVMSDLERTVQVADTYRVNLEALLDMLPDRFESWALLVNQQGQNHHQRRRQLIESAYELLRNPVAVSA